MIDADLRKRCENSYSTGEYLLKFPDDIDTDLDAKTADRHELFKALQESESKLEKVKAERDHAVTAGYAAGIAAGNYKAERDEALRRLGECIKGLRQLEGAESAGVRLHVQRVLESVVERDVTPNTPKA